MPKIEIKTEEVVKSTSRELIDNCALMPLFVIKGKAKDVKVYTDKDTFKADYPIANITPFTTGSGTSAVTIYDKTWYAICSLLDLGMPIVVKPIISDGFTATDENTAEQLCVEALDTAIATTKIYEDFKSKNLYNLKFITTGAHDNKGFASVLVEIASERKDAIALVEFPEDETVDTLLTEKSAGTASEYAAAFYPWCNITCENLTYSLPASIAYLLAYAYSLKSYSEWFAIAGSTRGYIPGLVKAKVDVTEAQADSMQIYDQSSLTASSANHICVNPIMLQNSVYRIWGNRTTAYSAAAESSDTYKKFLNVSILTSGICRAIYRAAASVIFDPNDNKTYIDFINSVNKTLDKMRYNRGLDWYSWKKDTSSAKGSITAQLTLKPIEAVEEFSLGIILTDSDASVE